MADPAVDVLQRGFAAFNRNDLDAVLEFCHPEIEWRPMRRSRAGTVYRGHDGVRQAMADIAEEFEELRNDPRDFTVIGSAVVVSGRLVAKERATGVRVDRSAAWMCELKDDRLVHMQAFPDGPTAQAAARRRALAET